MKITQVLCRNFRNLDSCLVSLDVGMNVIVGKNGQGKTNFLESIYYLSTTRSFRINHDQELIQHGKELARIECRIQDEEINRHLACVIHNKGKTCFISNQQVPRTSEFAGKLNAVLFAPADLEMFTASPRFRRRLIDVEIGKINSLYSVYLNRYNKLLKERNAALKQEKLDEAYLDVIEEQMVEAELYILARRIAFIEFVNERLSRRYAELSDQSDQIVCRYRGIAENADDESKEALKKKLKESRQKDWFLKSTSVGIHRDDIVFMMNENFLDSVASQGQRRMVVLSLKLAFIDYVLKETGKLPVLLLDDVLSELDEEKRKNLFRVIPANIQTVITTTEINDILSGLPSRPMVMKMENGILSKEE